MTTTENSTGHMAAGVGPSRFVLGETMLLGGIRKHYTFENRGNIPELWARFAPHIDVISGQAIPVTYGVIISTRDGNGFDYLAAVEVTDLSRLPADAATLNLPAQRYAVFAHEGHISTLCETIDRVFHQWLPLSGHAVTGNPDYFERYGEAFNPETGSGDVEIWVPVKA
jgi:AraC family transcriptional regulator